MKRNLVIAALSTALLAACGGGGGTSGAVPTAAATATPSATSTPGSSSGASSSYAAAYKAVSWGANVSVSFPSSCSMTFTTNGQPTYHADYYLAPMPGASDTIVAYTSLTDTALYLINWPSSNIVSSTVTVNTCPSKAAATTATNMGPIGYTIAGEAIFNPYEQGGTPALEDNASYSFTANGTQETASFVDSCNSHAASVNGQTLWHHHGVPTCLTQQVDGDGPSHIIGFALDGFPIYGGRDVNGNVVSVSQLDACNGITSPTPEFPNGAYHYVLPIGVTDKYSSLNCYAGTPE